MFTLHFEINNILNYLDVKNVKTTENKIEIIPYQKLTSTQEIIHHTPKMTPYVIGEDACYDHNHLKYTF